MVKYTFESITKLCKDKGVTFAWTEDEFKEKYKTTKTNVDIISSCGHKTIVQLNNLIHSNTGVVCKQCHYYEYKQNHILDNNFQEYKIIKSLQK